ncbi:hypothetical protein JCM10449v2_007895 [Rhodotorula kratochvilovae]
MTRYRRRCASQERFDMLETAREKLALTHVEMLRNPPEMHQQTREAKKKRARGDGSSG